MLTAIVVIAIFMALATGAIFRFTETQIEIRFKKIMKRYAGILDDYFGELPKARRRKKDE